MRPPFAYFGGKVGLAHRIIELFPPHRVYIEPYLGCGAVFFAKQPATHEILNDLDDGVSAFFRCLRERPEDLERACRLTPYARAEWARSADRENLEELELARRFWVRVSQSFGHLTGARTGFSVTTTRTQSTAASTQSRIDRFEACARRLAQATIEHCDGAQLIERLATPDTVVYCDPPYLAETRRGRTGGRPSDYSTEMGSREEHERLAEILHATSATVLLSGYPSDLYEDLYGGWWRIEIPTRAHSSNATSGRRGERIEVLWSNREMGVGLFAGGTA